MYKCINRLLETCVYRICSPLNISIDDFIFGSRGANIFVYLNGCYWLQIIQLFYYLIEI